VAQDGNPTAPRSRIEEIVLTALELSGDQRAAYLETACGQDGELRREVESMLAQENRAQTFLETPALEAAARALAGGAPARIEGRTAGPYRIEALIGVGGMGEVYRALDTRLRRPVALKFLAGVFSTETAAVGRFGREARAASALNHPNICTVYDVGEIEGRPFIAMECLEGKTLRACLGEGLTERLALDYGVQISQGLAAAHRKDIVHCDLKPENLWITSEGRVKILDFGLAKFAGAARPSDASGAVTDPGRVMGTAGYMSPEQVRAQPLDHRSDIFSLGAILHEMLAGSRAFQGASTVDTMFAILHNEPPELPQPVLKGLVRRCLEKDPARRFQSAEEVTGQLRAALEGRLVAGGESAGPARRSRRAVLIAGSAFSAAALAGAWRWRNRLPWASRPRIARLAVLPLTDLSAGGAQEAFTDGMTDLLITDLGQIGALRVIARPSVMQFQGTKQPLREIARRLGVESIVVGTVQSSGNRVRITAQLIDPETDQQTWSGAYERELTDVLALQSEVARAIADEIQARVTVEEVRRLAHNRKIVPAALGAYLRGRYYWDRFTDESLTKAIECYEEAIQLDPGYAAAYAGVAICWGGLIFSDARSWEEAISKAREAATKAITLDDELSEAHQAMALVHYHEWDWKGVETEVRKAIALNTGYSTSHVLYSNMLRHLGRGDESIAEAKAALDVDPLSMVTNQMLGNAYASARRYQEAIGQYQKGLELHADDSSLQLLLGWAYVYNGALDQGIAAIQSSLDVDGIDPRLSPDLAVIDAMRGETNEARQTLNRLLTLAESQPVSPGMIALVYIAVDDLTQGLNWLEKAHQQHSSVMTWLKTDPRFDKVRGEARFQELMRRVGLI